MVIKKTEIREKIESRLLTLTTFEPSPGVPIPIFNNPFQELTADELPCFKIGFEDGDATEFNSVIEYKRKDRLVIAYIVKGNAEGLQAKLEAAEEIISDFIISDHNNNESPDSLYDSFDEIKYRGWSSQYENAESAVAAVKLKFDITYYTNHTLDFEDFNTAVVEIKPNGATDDTRIIASNTIDLSET